MKHDQNYGMKALWAYVRSLGPLDKPSREWRGLTDEEIDDIYMGAGKHDLIRARAIEAKLKEKNT